MKDLGNAIYSFGCVVAATFWLALAGSDQIGAGTKASRLREEAEAVLGEFERG